MVPVIKTNNTVTLSFAKSVLEDSGIDCFEPDTHISILEGSIGAIPRRLMVLEEDEIAARRALALAGLADELYKD